MGASAFGIHLKTIQKIEILGWSMEPKIHIFTTKNETLIFGSSSLQNLFQSFYAPLCSTKISPPFRDLRYFPKISQNRARRKLEELKVTLREKEEAQLIDWCIHKCNASQMEVGWLLLTSDRLCFIDLKQGISWSSTIKDIQNNHPNKTFHFAQ